MEDRGVNQEEQLLTFMAHLEAGRKADASRVLNEIIAATPEKAGPYALLIGGMLAQNGQFAEAVPLYQEALRLNQDDPAAYFYLAKSVTHTLLAPQESAHAPFGSGEKSVC